eukprot:4649054-Prymnesium_polylepis.1
MVSIFDGSVRSSRSLQRASASFSSCLCRCSCVPPVSERLRLRWPVFIAVLVASGGDSGREPQQPKAPQGHRRAK